MMTAVIQERVSLYVRPIGFSSYSIRPSTPFKMIDAMYTMMLSLKRNLDNCTKLLQTERCEPKGELRMSKSNRIRVTTGYDKNGKPIQIQVSGRTQNDINDAIVRAYVDSGRIWEFMPKPVSRRCRTVPVAPAAPEKPKTSFAAYAQEWFELYVRPNISLGRERALRSCLKQCIEAFPDAYIEDITVKDIAKVMDQWGKVYAYNTMNSRRTTLKRIFECAVRDGLIRTNPASDSRIKNTSANKPETRSLSVEEVSDILANLHKLPTLQQQTMIAIYLFMGLRREELLGIMWEDIDLDKNQIHIQRAVVYYGGVTVKPPKTKQGDRRLLICQQLRDLLIRHERRTGFLFSEDGSEPLPLRMYEKDMKFIRETLNLSDVNSREFRRTFSTLLIAANVPLPVVQANMGHTKPNMTLQAYAKVEQHSWENSRDAISDLITSRNSTKDHNSGS